MADKKEKKKVPTAKKRDIQNLKKRLQNKQTKSQIRTSIRQFEEAVSKGDAKQVQEALNQAYAILDKSAKNGIYKRNKVSRTKSRLAAKAAAAI